MAITTQQINEVNVKYCRDNTLVSMGRLALKGRNILFEYAPSFLQLGLELSPLKMSSKLRQVIKIQLCVKIWMSYNIRENKSPCHMTL